MPVFNLTIPDTSPLIAYDGTWGDSSHIDSAWVDYANGTFHATQEYGASATLVFNGSAVYIFGARRDNHDYYTTTLDGMSTTGATNLGGQQHRLVLTNTFTTPADPWVDIDYMVITSGDGNAQTQSADVWLDDGAHNIAYSDGWDTSPNGLEASYYMNTMHRTNVNGASASLLFNGSAITVYGATSTDYGLFSISLDGNDPPLLLNGSAPVFRPQNMLVNVFLFANIMYAVRDEAVMAYDLCAQYYAGGLSDETHNLTFTNADPNGSWFDLDKFVVSTWPTFETVATSSSSSFTQGPDPTLLSPSQAEPV
ncbi:hypothetical protein EW026_g3508 [Hermanssonia centrifuga]|uniref:Uncharacterized protein n=1 Tax=Hermanssonia centrifuga TaxID=98765 RepID=A0A4S4KJY3_9APHY|nr:hypothetical protein EW026_g3508 [Hermanssonia centrifuga]